MEFETQKIKVDKMRADGKDEYDIKKQVGREVRMLRRTSTNLSIVEARLCIAGRGPQRDGSDDPRHNEETRKRHRRAQGFHRKYG